MGKEKSSAGRGMWDGPMVYAAKPVGAQRASCKCRQPFLSYRLWLAKAAVYGKIHADLAQDLLAIFCNFSPLADFHFFPL